MFKESYLTVYMIILGILLIILAAIVPCFITQKSFHHLSTEKVIYFCHTP